MRIFRLDPSFDPFESRGFAIRRDPSDPHSGGSSLMPARSRPPGRVRRRAPRPVRRSSPWCWPHAPARPPRRRRPARPRVVASAAPTATVAPTPTASPITGPGLPRHRDRRRGTAITLASAPQKIVSLTPAVTETLFAVGAGRPGRRHGRLQRLPGRGQAAAGCRDLRDGRRREDRQPRPGPRHRRWRRVHVGRIDRPAARAQDPGPRRLERDARQIDTDIELVGTAVGETDAGDRPRRRRCRRT